MEAVQCLHGASEGNQCEERFIPTHDEPFCPEHTPKFEVDREAYEISIQESLEEETL